MNVYLFKFAIKISSLLILVFLLSCASENQLHKKATSVESTSTITQPLPTLNQFQNLGVLKFSNGPKTPRAQMRGEYAGVGLYNPAIECIGSEESLYDQLISVGMIVEFGFRNGDSLIAHHILDSLYNSYKNGLFSKIEEPFRYNLAGGLIAELYGRAGNAAMGYSILAEIPESNMKVITKDRTRSWLSIARWENEEIIDIWKVKSNNRNQLSFKIVSTLDAVDAGYHNGLYEENIIALIALCDNVDLYNEERSEDYSSYVRRIKAPLTLAVNYYMIGDTILAKNQISFAKKSLKNSALIDLHNLKETADLFVLCGEVEFSQDLVQRSLENLDPSSWDTDAIVRIYLAANDIDGAISVFNEIDWTTVYHFNLLGKNGRQLRFNMHPFLPIVDKLLETNNVVEAYSFASSFPLSEYKVVGIAKIAEYYMDREQLQIAEKYFHEALDIVVGVDKDIKKWAAWVYVYSTYLEAGYPPSKKLFDKFSHSI